MGDAKAPGEDGSWPEAKMAAGEAAEDAAEAGGGLGAATAAAAGGADVDAKDGLGREAAQAEEEDEAEEGLTRDSRKVWGLMMLK